MDKESIKTLCESNPQLQWWAMVLFAEISALIGDNKEGYLDAAVLRVIQSKVEEFPKLVVQESLNAAKGKPSYDSRLAAIEERVKQLEDK